MSDEKAEREEAEPEEAELEEAEAEEPEAEEPEAETESVPDDGETSDADAADETEEDEEAEEDEAEEDVAAEAEESAAEESEEEDAEDAETETDAEAEETDSDDSEQVAAASVTEERQARGQRRGAHARKVTPRERLRELIAPQANRTQALIALACLVVGFGLSVQVTSTSQESSFSSLRQSELVSLLDRLNKRQDDLRSEVNDLEQERAALQNEDSKAARKAAQDRQHTLAILAGTEPATGPGIELTISDPKDGVSASDMLNTVQELRDAGAEVLQIGDVRIGVDSYFVDARGGIVVDGKKLTAPYRIKAIGDPHTMSTALDIPGGVLESLHRADAEGRVTESQSVAVTAIRKT